MVYTIVNSKGRSFDLPKKTVSVMEDLDQAITIDNNRNLSLREKYSHLHEFVKRTLGEEKAKECLGSDNLDEIDLSELAITVRKIHDSYDKPIADYATAKMREKLASVPMEKITPMVAAAKEVTAQKR